RWAWSGARGLVAAVPPLVALAGTAAAQESIRIDGRPDEPAWDRAVEITEFVQGEPVEGAAPGAETTAWLLFNDEGIHVAARMREPLEIARQLVRRDEEGQADYFEVSFDPNRDRRTGYLFHVSAAGVQRDVYLHDDDETDDSWDAVWESEVALEPGGWTLEMRIPWSQIRYEPGDGPQTWGVNVVRWRVEAGERTYHALVPRNERGRVSFFRPLAGISVPASDQRIEVRPYVLARARTAPAEEANPFFDGRETGAQVGGDLRYGLGSAFTLDATINPDFGQVELDPAVINLSAFETFFDERRPFFVEDARILDFSLAGRGNRLFYSRRIGREPQGREPDGAIYVDVPVQSTILGAAKLTGRTGGGLSIGALAAVTDREEGQASLDAGDGPDIIAFPAAPRTWHGVLRARQDLREGATTVGGIATVLGRELGDGGDFDFLPSSAFAGGVDFEHLWDDRRWALEGYLAGTMVHGDTTALVGIQRGSTHYFQRPDSRFSVDSTATSMVGASWRLAVERRTGGHWSGNLSLGQTTPGFEVNDMGFATSREQIELHSGVQYREIEPGAVFRDYSVQLSTYQNWRGSAFRSPLSGDAWTRAHKGGSIWLEADWTLNNFWGGFAEYAYRPEALDEGATRGGPLMVTPANQKGEIRLHTDRRRPVSLQASALVERGDAIDNREFGLELTWRPGPRLELEMEPEYSRTTELDQYVGSFEASEYAATYGRRYLFGELERRTLSLETRMNVTFTRNLTLQLYVQPLLDAGDYRSYRQLERPSSFSFLEFQEGEPVDEDGDQRAESCAGGTICELDGTQHVDFDDDGLVDARFSDADFNVVSLRGNAVLRWEYRPGSTIYLVWQQRRFGRRPFGDFDLSRDRGDLLDLHPENQFILKVNYWIGL
ncbi:MAG TPA: DUF5916 domain-containing protein, partial [Longimicrobiales bacterium]|nr:DUF5916 domain-containing protein [Longimicrobiales bacterium]